ncbi:hypothetical protein NQ317_013447 [Molorchus minor]|uniref:Uncharacterized protein n=1 Tax=Molorchus minor TaxID=1323400 RepID=A0ABQ9J5C8_9CUCU|nr:hypothetical protein NQ317_013447 [Molorchus minor]
MVTIFYLRIKHAVIEIHTRTNNVATGAPQLIVLAQNTPLYYSVDVEIRNKWLRSSPSGSFSSYNLAIANTSRLLRADALDFLISGCASRILRLALRAARDELNCTSVKGYVSYPKPCSLLKLKSTGYKTKKSKFLTPEQIKHFLLKPPDREYLFTKRVVEKIYCTTRLSISHSMIENPAYGVVLNSLSCDMDIISTLVA